MHFEKTDFLKEFLIFAPSKAPKPKLMQKMAITIIVTYVLSFFIIKTHFLTLSISLGLLHRPTIVHPKWCHEVQWPQVIVNHLPPMCNVVMDGRSRCWLLMDHSQIWTFPWWPHKDWTHVTQLWRRNPALYSNHQVKFKPYFCCAQLIAAVTLWLHQLNFRTNQAI